ncbi:MAG: monofunctional biosynthetic peptidoglycan transglycosylase [Gammaproteobacteria bacterium]|nr:monofunctional biosynthetic peptidoglycan transglycosylase [Gammaproteobacteria bacterium]
MRRRRLWPWLLALLFVPLVLLLAGIAALRWLPPPTTAFMLASATQPVRQEWVAWETLPAALKLAVVAAEDQRFLQHRGFDTVELRRVLTSDGLAPTRGASTLSQQVAKNLFLWSGGGLFRKGLEAGITVGLELLWPKRRILEVYLNVAEFAPGVYGAEAAAWHHFNKPAAQLSQREAALLAAVLPSPRRFNASAASPYVRERADWIQGQMRALGPGWLAELD